MKTIFNLNYAKNINLNKVIGGTEGSFLMPECKFGCKKDSCKAGNKMGVKTEKLI